MSNDQMMDRAARFGALNRGGGLILPNAWDAVSARLFEAAGFSAVGTTSAGVAYTRGVRDGERLGRDVMLGEIATIARAVAIPVTADVESAYGGTLADVEETVAGVIAAGAVGINLEDRSAAYGAGALIPIPEAAARISAARTAADARGVPIVINARTDVFLLGLGRDRAERVAMTIERGRAYLAAGADLIFVPGAAEITTISELVGGIGGPVSVMVVPGLPPAAELFAAGVHRVSFGPAAMFAAMGTLRRLAAEVAATGTWDPLDAYAFGFGFGDAEALFTR